MKFDAILNLEELGPIMTSPDGLTTELKVLNCGNEVHRITVENYQIILWDHRDQDPEERQIMCALAGESSPTCVRIEKKLLDNWRKRGLLKT
jgi:hypothetical protein